jgi:hypothetical protein
MWSKIISILRFLEGVALLGLAFVFLRWYVKGHFGKYFILFWLNTILSFIMYFNHQNQIEQEYDHRTGAEIWNEMHR